MRLRADSYGVVEAKLLGRRVYLSSRSMTVRSGLILYWCLVLAVHSAYAPPSLSGPSFQPISASLPFRCSAGFQLNSRVRASPPALPRAARKGSAFPGAVPVHSSGAVPPRRRPKPLSSSRAKTAGLAIHPDQWVKAQIDAFVKSARAAYEKDGAQSAYERVLDGIVRTIRQRKLSEDPDSRRRYREFLEYISAASIDRQPDHELGFLVPDRQYFADTRQYVEIPEFLLNQDFLRSVSRDESLDRAKAFLRELNRSRQASDQLIYFSYHSRHLGTPDNDDSYRRLLIVVPGNVEKRIPEKWVQFGVSDPGVRTRTRNVSVLSAVVDSDGTYVPYFKDYYRTYTRDGSIRIGGRWELGFGDDNCAKCHKSGILPIFPVAGSVKQDELPAVETVNERFRSYGSPRFDKYLDPASLGPGLGSATEESRSRRFGQAFGQTAAGSSMSCSVCHQPAGLGSLTWPMDRILISSYVKGGQMPFGSTLTGAQRSELYAKLIQEYFSIDEQNPGILKSWLLGKPLSSSELR